MNQLIKIYNGNENQLIDGRELHLKLESKRQFANWISQRIEKYGFIENEDYFTENHRLTNLLSKEQISKGGTNKIDYLITINMAKELAMVQDNEIGRQIRRYFIAIEKQSQATLLKMPASLFASNGLELVPYEWWLLQNGYSCSGGNVRMRRLKHPTQFHKHSGTEKWYITRNLANALLGYRTAKTKIESLQELPVVEQLDIFN